MRTVIMSLFISYLPLWIFSALFKMGGSLHYAALTPLGEHVLPLWMVGIIIGIAAGIQMMLDVPAGFLIDKFGSVRLIKLSTLLFMGAAALLACFEFSLPVYVSTILLATFGWLFYGPGINAYVLSHASSGEAGRFLSMRDMTASVGVVVSSAMLAFGLLLPPQWLGALIFVILLGAFFAVMFVPSETSRTVQSHPIETHAYYIRRHHPHTLLATFKTLNPAALTLSLLSFASAIFYSTIWFVVPLVVAQLASQSAWAGVWLGIFDLTIIAIGYWVGILADRADKRTLVFFGILLFAVAGALTGYSFSWVFLLFGFLATTGHEAAGLSLWSWLHALDRDHAHDGMVAGAITFTEDAGWMIGPMLAGFSYWAFGPAITITLSAVCIFATWLAYVFVSRPHQHMHIEGPLPHFPLHRRHK